MACSTYLVQASYGEWFGCSLEMRGSIASTVMYIVCGNINLPATDWGGSGSYNKCNSKCQACQTCEAFCQTGKQLVSDYLGNTLKLGQANKETSRYDLKKSEYINIEQWNGLVDYINNAANNINYALDQLIDKGNATLESTIGTELKDYIGENGIDQANDDGIGGYDIKGSTKIDSAYLETNKITNSEESDGTLKWVDLPRKTESQIITAEDFNKIKDILGRFKYEDTFTGKSMTLAEEASLLASINIDKYSPSTHYENADITAQKVNSLVDIINTSIKVPKVLPQTLTAKCVKCQFKQTTEK